MLAKIQSWIHQVLSKNTTNQNLVGFFLTSKAIYMTELSVADGKPLQYAKVDINSQFDYVGALKQLIREQKLAKLNCCFSLPPQQYQMLVVDKPDVDDEDLTSALKYAAKDDISGDLENYIVEYFDIPAQPFGQSKVNLVAGKRQFILDLVKVPHSRDLTVGKITIEDLLYKSLFDDCSDAVLLVSHQESEELLIQIVKQGFVFFSRRIRGYNKINQFAELEIEHGVADSLSLEIQRSLDYFESQLRQAPVKRIYFAIDTQHQALLLEKVGANFPIPVLSLKNWLGDDFTKQLDDLGYIGSIAAAKSLIVANKLKAESEDFNESQY